MAEKRLLVIDDERDIGEFIRTVAEEMGYEVMVTSAADEFQAAYASFHPTHIMLDIVMPDIDGIELLRYLASSGCQSRVLVMSGYSEKYLDSAQKLSDAYGLRNIDRLTKPIRLAKLREVLSS
ncbi:MAG TPA: response regulator [Alphaproteobacteria bacterium]|jgi:DNA-binding NtrC family response regulator|nr:response regulator [Alphaproteobacteria bacterium]